MSDGHHGGGGFFGMDFAAPVAAVAQFGEHAAGAFLAFSRAWQVECQVLEGAVRELHRKIGASAVDYHGTDKAIAVTLGSVPSQS
ncbi:hypothetical protein ACQEVS_02650 [Streptomyces sp. CA-181903]|uniref:hypothetical protein n=1 Tax=Streptomyces sp. CA-181903 TaxID=3240055 RepID=UPI003D8D191B